jgi:hypothetical protein
MGAWHRKAPLSAGGPHSLSWGSDAGYSGMWSRRFCPLSGRVSDGTPNGRF